MAFISFRSQSVHFIFFFVQKQKNAKNSTKQRKNILETSENCIKKFQSTFIFLSFYVFLFNSSRKVELLSHHVSHCPVVLFFNLYLILLLSSIRLLFFLYLFAAYSSFSSIAAQQRKKMEKNIHFFRSIVDVRKRHTV